MPHQGKAESIKKPGTPLGVPGFGQIAIYFTMIVPRMIWAWPGNVQMNG
ncbi:hypothetical protein NT6N_20000 [Oceaniferula spumae]|uniref:Uncharacterized protein n=1 Tax=Oceaniferula spumae TaxID=2979115 RepID=A0AAT9FLW5_9BACT